MRWLLILTLLVQTARWCQCQTLNPSVEIEETVYAYTNANNGAGPMWCAGSTSITRVGDRVFATGLETIPDAQPLNNCRWVLWERVENHGWQRLHEDAGRTREPSPIASYHSGHVFVSGNPTLSRQPEPEGGPTQPDLFRLDLSAPAKNPSTRLLPEWHGMPQFREHSYRTLAADGARGELLLMQNIDYAHAEWAFQNAAGQWQAKGQINWPMGSEYQPPKPVRLCYPNVALRDRAVHFFGIGDITEPNAAWREHKRRLTGRKWDYVFRRLYYTWTPDITTEPFRPWVEIANREATAGQLWPCDLWLGEGDSVHLLWSERAIDERLRPDFFPQAKQSSGLHHAILRDGNVIHRKAVYLSNEDQPGLSASRARFHATPDRRLLVLAHVTGPGINENRVSELLPDLTLGATARVPLRHPFSNFFTATSRAGSAASETIDILGNQTGSKANTISYARVRLD